ncbi:MAG: hypothetical protein RIT25_1511, partial [Planctomycetota bacterium]
MTDPAPAPQPSKALPLGTVLLVAVGVLVLSKKLREVTEALESLRAEQAILTAEVTRFRIEQRAEGKGPQALLE